MKCIVIVVAILFASQINSTIRYPNILLTFKTLSDYQFIEYSIETIEGSFSPLHILKLYTISLRVRALNTKPYFTFDILFRYKSEFDCDTRFNIPLLPIEKRLDEYDNCETKLQEILPVLSLNSSALLFMQFYGCNNSKLDDKMHENQIDLHLYKNSEPIEVRLWNETYTVHSSMLGYIKIMNIATKGNSDEENEGVFNDLTEYCQKVANISNKNYIPTFDDIYFVESTDNSQKFVNAYKLPLVVMVFLAFIILIAFFVKKFNRIT